MEGASIVWSHELLRALGSTEQQNMKTFLCSTLNTVKKERKYILPYALSLALTEQLFKVGIIYKGNQG